MNGSNAVLCSGMEFSIGSGLKVGSMLLCNVLGKAKERVKRPASVGDAVFKRERESPLRFSG